MWVRNFLVLDCSRNIPFFWLFEKYSGVGLYGKHPHFGLCGICSDFGLFWKCLEFWIVYLQRSVSVFIGSFQITASVQEHLCNVHTSRVGRPVKTGVLLLIQRKHSCFNLINLISDIKHAVSHNFQLYLWKCIYSKIRSVPFHFFFDRIDNI